MAHNYVVTAHKASSVTDCVVGHFTAPDELNLIVSKSTHVEIHLVTSDGLQPLHDVPIYGRVAAMKLFRPKAESRDLLFLSTERYRFCILGYEAGELVTLANGDLQDRRGRPTDVGQIGIVDPDCRLIGLHLYDGLFKVVPMEPEKGRLAEAFNVRLEELQVLDIQFLYGCEKPTIAVLYQDPKEARHVKTYEVLMREKELVEGRWAQPNVEASASIIIPVPAPLGGAIVIGEQTIAYYNGIRSQLKAISMKSTIVKAYGRIDTDGSRYLLGDHMGNLSVLVLKRDAEAVIDLKLERLGETSCASSIAYLDNGVVFVGSLFGDSQLIRLLPEKDEKGSHVEVLNAYANLGPILDFVAVDLERQGQGQGQVVTCSGAYRDGTLRVVRNGIGINEQANIELPGLKGMWSLRGSEESPYDSYLVVSFISETKVLASAGPAADELEERTIPGFDSEKQALYCGDALHGQLLQVTADSVRLVDGTSLELVAQWPDQGNASITVAAANLSQVVIAERGGKVYYLEISRGKLTQRGVARLEHEVACLDITPLEGHKTAEVCAAGLWTDMSVHVLALPDLQSCAQDVLGGEVVPRSLLYNTLGNEHYLLGGLGDGHLVIWRFDPASRQLSHRKRVPLATQPVILHPFRSGNTTHVFACCDRPTVIYAVPTTGKLVYSNVNLREVAHMCSFSTEAFTDSLALATDETLTIGTVDEIQKLHIRTVELRETPRRICHHEPSAHFGLLTTMITAEEEEVNWVRLLHEQTFEVVDSHRLETNEMGCSIIACSLEDDPQTYIVVGTTFADPQEPEPTRGRILVFSVQDSKLVLVAEKEVKGIVYSLCSFNTKLLSTIGAKVSLFKWVLNQSTGLRELVPECAHYGHIMALYAATRGDFIVIGDLMKSVTLLTYKAIDGSMEEIARDYNPNWMTALEILDDDTYLGAENAYNLFAVRRNAETATDEERARLEVVGEYHLGDFVNRFRHGSLVMRMPESDAGLVRSTPLLYGTVGGALGVVAAIAEEQFQFFAALQQQLTKVVRGVGGFAHDQWRAFSNERKSVPSRGFIDGDLIERFLDLKPAQQAQVAQELAIPADEIARRIETISQALH